MSRLWSDIKEGDGGDDVPEMMDSSGAKEVVQFLVDENGEKRAKLIRKVKVVKKKEQIKAGVLQRRKWKKFGDCEGMGRGPEANITYVSSENIRLQLGVKKDEQEDDISKQLKKRKGDSIVVCRNCGETGHWTLKCPKRNLAMPKDGPASLSVEERKEMAAAGPSATASGTYRPPSMRGVRLPGVSMNRDDSNTLRVTELSEDANEDDLRELFRPFGHTTRVFLAKDHYTGESRGFAFISFTRHDEAEAARQALDGYGYDNRILRVDFSKPREPRD